MAGFVLDERLAGSSSFIADWDLCRVCLKNDKTWPWLYLVPKRDKIREIFELAPDDQMQLMREISRAAQALQSLHKADKINIAAYGNMVPQLHVHVFARFKDDPAWPKPVWTAQGEIPYTDSERETEIEKFKNCFGKLEA
ncbi:MAG: HIT domain-containing protein [Alphaproteobacteria bacterium]|nr:HIT family protein [Alphaproteobacteria bacterium]MDE2336544.1 HIT domain-containing protein [Alphaproteobacteria bacterium]